MQSATGIIFPPYLCLVSVGSGGGQSSTEELLHVVLQERSSVTQSGRWTKQKTKLC